MKKYGFRRKFNKDDNKAEETINEINKALTEINNVINVEIPKKILEEKKEKYKFRKKEKKEKKEVKAVEIKKEKNVETKKDKNVEIKKEKNVEIKKERKNKLKEDINEIERICTAKTLKKDLIDIYEKVLENNAEFRDKIFFKNLLDTERKIGKMDSMNKKQISHTFKEIETKNILQTVENENSLLNKYTLRAKRIVGEN